MVIVELKLNGESFFFPEQHTHFPSSFRTTFGTFEFRNYPPPFATLVFIVFAIPTLARTASIFKKANTH